MGRIYSRDKIEFILHQLIDDGVKFTVYPMASDKKEYYVGIALIGNDGNIVNPNLAFTRAENCAAHFLEGHIAPYNSTDDYEETK